MRVSIEKASDWDFEEIKEFNTVEELLQYMRNTYDSWIVEFPEPGSRLGVDLVLTIYDDYVE